MIREKVKEIKRRHPNFTNPHIAHVAERELKEMGILVKLSRATVRDILLKTSDYRPAVIRFRPAKRFEMENIGELVQLDTSSSRFIRQFISFYNQRLHQGIGETPNQRFQRVLNEGRTRFRPLPKDINLDDIFSLTEQRYLKKDRNYSLLQ